MKIMRFIALIAVTAALSLAPKINSASAGSNKDERRLQEIRAFKMTHRNTPWCVLITDEEGHKISQATFADNTDKLLSKLRIDLHNKGKHFVNVYFGLKSLTTQRPDIIFEIKDAGKTIDHELKITNDSVELVPKAQARSDEMAAASKKPSMNKSHDEEMKIRGYKTTSRNKKWCVQIVNQNDVVISEAKFNKNTDALPTAKGLKLQLGNDNLYNVIRVYKNDECIITDTPMESEKIKQFPPAGTQIHIGSDFVSLIPESAEPGSFPTRKVEVRKIDPSTYNKKWVIKTLSDDQNPESEISITSITKDSSGILTKGLEIAADRPTYVFVYKTPNPADSNPEITRIEANEQGDVLHINAKGEVVLVDKKVDAAFVNAELEKASTLRAKDKYKVKVKKTDPETQDKKWTIKAFTREDDPASEISSVSIKKDTSGFSKDLEIAKAGKTYIKVYDEGGTQLSMTPIQADLAKTLLEVDGLGYAKLVEDIPNKHNKDIELTPIKK